MLRAGLPMRASCTFKSSRALVHFPRATTAFDTGESQLYCMHVIWTYRYTLLVRTGM